jgi:hypothetical protein
MSSGQAQLWEIWPMTSLSDLAAHVGVQALERRTAGCRAAAADLEAERGLEGLGADRLAGVAERSLEQGDRGGVALLLELLDEQVEAAAAHVLVLGEQAGLGDGRAARCPRGG